MLLNVHFWCEINEGWDRTEWGRAETHLDKCDIQGTCCEFGNHNAHDLAYPKTGERRELFLEHDRVVFPPQEDNDNWSCSRSLCEAVYRLEQVVHSTNTWIHPGWQLNPGEDWYSAPLRGTWAKAWCTVPRSQSAAWNFYTISKLHICHYILFRHNANVWLP